MCHCMHLFVFEFIYPATFLSASDFDKNFSWFFTESFFDKNTDFPSWQYFIVSSNLKAIIKPNEVSP